MHRAGLGGPPLPAAREFHLVACNGMLQTFEEGNRASGVEGNTYYKLYPPFYLQSVRV